MISRPHVTLTGLLPLLFSVTPYHLLPVLLTEGLQRLERARAALEERLADLSREVADLRKASPR